MKHCTARKKAAMHSKIQISEAASYIETNTNQLCRSITNGVHLESTSLLGFSMVSWLLTKLILTIAMIASPDLLSWPEQSLFVFFVGEHLTILQANTIVNSNCLGEAVSWWQLLCFQIGLLQCNRSKSSNGCYLGAQGNMSSYTPQILPFDWSE